MVAGGPCAALRNRARSIRCQRPLTERRLIDVRGVEGVQLNGSGFPRE